VCVGKFSSYEEAQEKAKTLGATTAQKYKIVTISQ
jgi:hypothetical protein